jgi:hypothetical protein
MGVVWINERLLWNWLSKSMRKDDHNYDKGTRADDYDHNYDKGTRADDYDHNYDKGTRADDHYTCSCSNWALWSYIWQHNMPW